MVYWILLLLMGIIILIVLLIFSSITVRIIYSRDPYLQDFSAAFYLLKKIKIYRKKITADDRYVETKIHQNKEEFYIEKFEKGIEIILKSFDILRIYNHFFKEVNERIRKGLRIEKFLLITDIGTGDAATTGLLCGFIWAFLGNLRVYGEVYFPEKIEFLVYPDFQKKVFKINIDCIFVVKTVHIIYVLKLIKEMFEVERKRLQNLKE